MWNDLRDATKGDLEGTVDGVHKNAAALTDHR